MDELRRVVVDLRLAIVRVPHERARLEKSAAALEDLKVVLDNARTDLFGMLAGDAPADHERFIRRLRLQRAAQACQSVLSGLLDGTISRNTEGVEALLASAAEVHERLS